MRDIAVSLSLSLSLSLASGTRTSRCGLGTVRATILNHRYGLLQRIVARMPENVAERRELFGDSERSD